MEMLRTIIVALFFAGITVCSYYFLSSSPFPWESQANKGNSVASDVANPAENGLSASSPRESVTPTFAQDGPFSPGPAVSETDDFSLPNMNELPEASSPAASGTFNETATSEPTIDSNLSVPSAPVSVPVTESGSAPSLVSTSTVAPQVSEVASVPAMAPPVLDTELPPLEEMKAATPFDAGPAPIQAQAEMQIGSDADSQSTQALPALENNGASEALPAPPILTDEGTDLSIPDALPTSNSSVPVQNEVPTLETSASATTNSMVNPLRGNSSIQSVENPLSASVSVPAQNNQSAGMQAQVAPNVQSPVQEDPETLAVREYLQKAQEKIQTGHSLEVLQELSKFYGNSRFSAEESAQLINILVQAATQVIYSQESILEPAYTVQPGDSLEKIAFEYQIPEDFIVRVNGLQPGVPLQPGTKLKVIRGPFHAIVYLDRHEMLLTLNGLFASRFWIGIGGELVQKDGDFSFAQKSVQEAAFEFLRLAGEPGCADLMKVQATSDLNAIGGTAPRGAILMSPADVDCLGALLGPKSQLIMRCRSPKPVVQQAATVPEQTVGSSLELPPATNSPAPTAGASLELPAVSSSPAPTVGSSVGIPSPEPTVGASVGLSDSLPNELPGTMPASEPAFSPAPEPAVGELPLELPDTL